MSYAEKMAKKNKIPYTITKKIYLNDFDTYITTTGDGTLAIFGNGARIDIDKSGNVNISGTSVKIDGQSLDFSELPDRYVRSSGISWDWIRNNTEVFGALPIRIKGRKVYIPFIGEAVE